MYKSTDALFVSTDSVLLADFAAPFAKGRGLDMGCGSGLLSIILAYDLPELYMDGVEIEARAAELARSNVQKNGLSDRIRKICADLRTLRETDVGGKYDFIVSNPPYFPPGSGTVSEDPQKAAAKSESLCTLRELAESAARLLGTGGRLFMVHKPERLSEIFRMMSESSLEPKRLRLVEARPGAAPSLALMELRRGGRPGLVIEPALRLKDENGAESAEYRKIYRL